MMKYFYGFLINFFNFRISKFALIDNISVVKNKAKIYSKCQIFNSNIGSYSYVTRNTSIVHANIGAFCSISNNVRIGMGQHKVNSISTSPIFYSKNNALGISWGVRNEFEEFQRVNVGSDVWIGTGVMIMSGVSIGHGAIIGAGAIVTKDIPNYAIVVGIPAKIIKYRFDEKHIKSLIDSEWWNWSEKDIRDKIHLFESDEVSENFLNSLSK
jgi:acetyltransferase-like isoleucine patch superfamily enzyme